MINKIMKSFLMIFLLLSVFTVNAQEVSKTGTTAAKFLNILVGPRAIGMGAAYAAVANDPYSMYWNPAGIADIDKYKAAFSYTKVFADVKLNYVAAVIPAGEFGSIGFNVTALFMNDMEVTTENYPEGTGELFSAGSFALGLSYARNITTNFSAGINIKYIRENIYNSSANGFAFDVGTKFLTPFWDVMFASSITNVGTKMQMSGDDLLIRHDQDPTRNGNNETIDANYKTDEFDLPLRLQVGLSKEFELLEGQKVTVAVDAIHPNDNDQWVNTGIEFSLFDNLLALRAGYKTLFLKDSQEGLTLGFGLAYDKFGNIGIAVDYAYQKYEYLEDIHSFGICLSF